MQCIAKIVRSSFKKILIEAAIIDFLHQAFNREVKAISR